jgi:hypothetical protein
MERRREGEWTSVAGFARRRRNCADWGGLVGDGLDWKGWPGLWMRLLSDGLAGWYRICLVSLEWLAGGLRLRPVEGGECSFRTW